MTISQARFAASCCFPMVLFLVTPVLARARGADQSPALDPVTLELHNVKAESVEYLGRKAVRLIATAPDGAGLAMLPATQFQDGTIEGDLAVKITTPPGVRMPGFIGLAFRVRPDASGYEVVYFRPKNALSDDQAMRNHAVQYCAEPDYGWYRLRREWPFIYETYADIQPEAWMHVKIDVAGRSARIYLNDSTKPSLVVDGLKSPDLKGGVGLWGYAGEESYFSNLRITPATPQPVKNESDATGTWKVRFSSDAGRFEGVMKLSREGNKLSGAWSGELGDNKPISGTWRGGHIELTFQAEWPNDGRDGAPGPAPAFLEGWIDDATGKGRMRIEGRADGPWTAERQNKE